MSHSACRALMDAMAAGQDVAACVKAVEAA